MVHPEQSSGELAQPELAAAYEAGYTLLARLYLDGLSTDLEAYVQGVDALREPAATFSNRGEAAAAHQALFGYQLFPYQSMFLDTSGLLGGEETERVQHAYAALGFSPGAAVASPDHLGHELELMAFLSGAEADAWRDGATAHARRMQQQQAAFLTDHLLRWLPPVLIAVEQEGQPFYTAVARMTADLLHAQAETLTVAPQAAPRLPSPPDVLADQKTGLRDIAGHILTPPYSGIYLGREGVARLARAVGLPRGFGGGRDMLLNLFRSAAQYEEVPRLLDALDSVIGVWQTHYRDWRETYGCFVPFITPWEARAAESRLLVAELERGLGSVASDA